MCIKQTKKKVRKKINICLLDKYHRINNDIKMNSTQLNGRSTQRHVDYDIEDSLIRKKAEECVQYILYCYLAERKAVIRRADLNKHVIKEYSKSFRTIFQMVDKHLLDVFGLRCIDLDGNDKFEKFGVRSKFKFDSDLNKCDNAINKHLTRFSNDSNSHESDREFQDQLKYSMLMISLSIIFMNDNEIDEGLFFDSLKKLDINRDEKKHKYLGDVHKYFTSELVKDGYLEYEQIKNIDPPSYKLKWGFRAKLEISKKSVLEFVCEVYGGKDACRPKEWVAQYNDASKQEDFADDESSEDEEMEEDTNDQNDKENEMTQPSRSTQRNNTQTYSNSRRTRANVIDEMNENSGSQATQSNLSQVVIKTQPRMRK